MTWYNMQPQSIVNLHLVRTEYFNQITIGIHNECGPLHRALIGPLHNGHIEPLQLIAESVNVRHHNANVTEAHQLRIAIVICDGCIVFAAPNAEKDQSLSAIMRLTISNCETPCYILIQLNDALSRKCPSYAIRSVGRDVISVFVGQKIECAFGVGGKSIQQGHAQDIAIERQRHSWIFDAIHGVLHVIAFRPVGRLGRECHIFFFI